jgi:hypothetical protein
VQHCPGPVDRHSDHGLWRNERRAWHHHLHQIYLHMQQRWPGCASHVWTDSSSRHTPSPRRPIREASIGLPTSTSIRCYPEIATRKTPFHCAAADRVRPCRNDHRAPAGGTIGPRDLLDRAENHERRSLGPAHRAPGLPSPAMAPPASPLPA